jgi:hypothetical protein
MLNESQLGRKHPRKVLYKIVHLVRSVNKHGYQRQFLFLINDDSFGQAVTEEKIFLEISQSETRIAMFDIGSGRNKQSALY